MIEIRRACSGDIQGILDLAAKTVTDTWTYNYVKSRLGMDDTCVLVAVDGDNTAGFLSCRQVGDDGELLQIAVDETKRRCGIGTALLRAAFEFARGRSLASFFLEVRAGNTAALALYAKHGFTQMRIRKNYYDNPEEDAIVMVKVL